MKINLLSFSDELLLLILANLNIYDLANTARVNKKFNSLANDKRLRLFTIDEAQVSQKVVFLNSALNRLLDGVLNDLSEEYVIPKIEKAKHCVTSIIQLNRDFDIGDKGIRLLRSYRQNYTIEWYEQPCLSLISHLLKHGLDINKRHDNVSLLSAALANKDNFPFLYALIEGCSKGHIEETKATLKF